MNSYIIDGSVYAKPSNINNPDVIYTYCKNVRKLRNIFEEKQPRNIRCFLSENDVEWVIRHGELFLSKNDVETMELCLAKAYETHREEKYKVNIRDAQISLDKFLSRLGIRSHLIETDNRNDDDKLKYHMLLKRWFNIADITFVETQAPVLPDAILSLTKNKKLRKNMRKNLALSAYLNKHVFYQKYDAQSVVLNVEEKTEVAINTSIAKVKMGKMWDKEIRQEVQFAIPGALDTNITLANENVNVINIDTLDSYCISQKKIEKDIFSSMHEVIARINVDFPEIIFCPETETGIKKYIENATNERTKLKNQRDKKVFEKIVSELPDILYKYMQVLYYLVMDTKKDKANLFKPGKYCSNQKRKYICQYCRGLIHLHGLDCSDENDEQLKKCKRAQMEREKDIGDGSRQMLTYHLKPISFKKGTVLDFLTLRIYFKLIKIDGQEKIAIGWIGKHLFLPEIDRANNICVSLLENFNNSVVKSK